MKNMLCTLLLCLFWVVVVRVDDLTEKSLLLFSKDSATSMGLLTTYNTVNIMTESENSGVAVLDRQS